MLAPLSHGDLPILRGTNSCFFLLFILSFVILTASLLCRIRLSEEEGARHPRASGRRSAKIHPYPRPFFVLPRSTSSSPSFGSLPNVTSCITSMHRILKWKKTRKRDKKLYINILYISTPCFSMYFFFFHRVLLLLLLQQLLLLLLLLYRIITILLRLLPLLPLLLLLITCYYVVSPYSRILFATVYSRPSDLDWIEDEATQRVLA